MGGTVYQCIRINVVNRDHQLISQLAATLGHVTVIHKGKEKDVQPQGEPDHQLISQLTAALGHVTVVHKGKQKDVQL